MKFNGPNCRRGAGARQGPHTDRLLFPASVRLRESCGRVWADVCGRDDWPIAADVYCLYSLLMNKSEWKEENYICQAIFSAW
jgi:hypothetical protein